MAGEINKYPMTLRGWVRFSNGYSSPGVAWSRPVKEAAERLKLENGVQIVGAIALGKEEKKFSKITLPGLEKDADRSFVSLAKVAGNGFDPRRLPEWTKSLNGFHSEMLAWTGVNKPEDLSVVLIPKEPESQGVAIYGEHDMDTVIKRLQAQQSVNGGV